MKQKIQNAVLKSRLEKISKLLSKDLPEKEIIISLSLLGAIAGQNTFLFGPPGTAKSLIARRVSKAFKEQSYFEALMNRFTTPEEVFGPISLTELKKDNYKRIVDNYLPDANFAFLDEIWKSSPAILNALLTITNEGIFKNGDEMVNVPLQSLICASNEIPKTEQGLDALYDRFILRLLANPVEVKENFEKVINAKPAKYQIDLANADLITANDLQRWREAIHHISLSKECLNIIHLIRSELSDNASELGIYVSDRRWQRTVYLMKAAAFCNDRKETNHGDALLLAHCLWDREETREQLIKIIKDSIQKVGIHSDISLVELNKEKEMLDKEIHKELYHSDDIYEEVFIKNDSYFKVAGTFVCEHRYYEEYKEKFTLYIPKNKMKSKKDFHPVDARGNELKHITCCFNGQGSCDIQRNKKNYHYSFKKIIFTPEILFHKGDKKVEINSRLVKSLKSAVTDIKEKQKAVLDNINNKLLSYEKELDSQFITESDINFILTNINAQITELTVSIKDCERLVALCK